MRREAGAGNVLKPRINFLTTAAPLKRGKDTKSTGINAGHAASLPSDLKNPKKLEQFHL